LIRRACKKNHAWFLVFWLPRPHPFTSRSKLFRLEKKITLKVPTYVPSR